MPNFAPSDTVNLKMVRPFLAGESIENDDGSRSTERAMSFNIEGKEVLASSLWMTPDGPVDLSRQPEVLIRAILAYEARTNKRSPRFDTPDEATAFSRHRSSSGGISAGPLED